MCYTHFFSYLGKNLIALHFFVLKINSPLIQYILVTVSPSSPPLSSLHLPSYQIHLPSRVSLQEETTEQDKIRYNKTR